ncbi:MAG: (2Fe-2S)-binding protein [Verrucomicrobia bacterium]|nr:(2Fe-2S)-binding protein [Verrucomicrobiota bacterium]MBS0637911.1 (2Fe-2S)-binding protein [Verrucomicrobiota bacterium]
MAKIRFQNTGDEVELPDNSPIAEVCEEAGIPFACTEGVCGTCIVEVVSGHENLSEPTQAEIDFLGESGTKRERMCCQAKIKEGLVSISF